MKVKIINQSANPLPEYKTSGSAGVDICANLEQPLVIRPLERCLVPTGLYVELPEGYEAQIRPRSGLAIHHGITCLNTPGTIDSDYRGEIKIILINLSDKEYMLLPGDRIAQMVIARYQRVEFVEVDMLQETQRGTGGFGHTGISSIPSNEGG